MITPTISIVFGSLALVVILGFVLLLRGPPRPRYEREDYFSRKREKRVANPEPSYSPRFDRQRPSYRSGGLAPPNTDGRKILAIVAIVAILGISISIVYQSFVGLLIIFALPIIVNYIRSRAGGANRGRNGRSDRDDSSSSSSFSN